MFPERWVELPNLSVGEEAHAVGDLGSDPEQVSGTQL